MINLGIMRRRKNWNSRKAVYGYDRRVEVFGSEGIFHSALLVRLIFVCCTRIVSIVFYNTIPFKTIMI